MYKLANHEKYNKIFNFRYALKKENIPLMKKFYVLLLLAMSTVLFGLDYKPIIPAKGYQHDKWHTEPNDIIKVFRAYIVSFDGVDDSDGDGDMEENDKLGEPEWVAYEIKRVTKPLNKGPKRPSRWLTDKKLAIEGVAPKDDTYRGSGYDRGHMCMKYIAWRLGENADWNTHTTLNACPQLHKFNAGIWLDLENLTQDWADKYGKVWVICGPVFMKNRPRRYIGDAGEKKIPIPDAFFKIVINQQGNSLHVLSFIFPHKEIARGEDKKYDYSPYLTTVDMIESLTGLDFFTDLPKKIQDKLEAKKSESLENIGI